MTSSSAAAAPSATSAAASAGARPALRARALAKSYDTPVLEGLDLDIEDGQFVAIMGPSGGSVLLGDTDIAALSERELAALRLSRFGFVFQQAHLLATLCLLDNIVLPGFLAGLRPRQEVEARGRELMERMGISELAGSDITEVSGGQLQRAGICRALINEPGIVFADEPTGALNSATAAQILDLLGEVHTSGTTLVVVTHDAQVAARADRVLLLVDGGVVEDLALGGYREAQASQRLATVSRALQRRSV